VCRMLPPRSQIILTDRFDETVEALAQAWPDTRFVRIGAEEFLVAHAEEAIRRAYLTDTGEKALVLSAERFTPIAQNKLLKILEEPPARTHFVLLTPSKASLLPTVRSRLPIVERSVQKKRDDEAVLLDLDSQRLFALLQTYRRADAATAKTALEAWGKEALESGRFRVDGALLESFQKGIRLLDMGSPPSFVLTWIGMKLLKRRQ